MLIVTPRLLSVALCLALTALGARARPAHASTRIPTHGAADAGPAVLIRGSDGDPAYSGIGRYEGRAQCTGVFLDTLDSDEPSDLVPAYVLTNGHCPEFPGSNEVLVDRPPRGRMIFNYFVDRQDRRVTVPVERLVYATMKGQDVAILQLRARYEELRALGIEPRPLTKARPGADEFVAVVGAPLQRDVSTSFLRLAACRLQGSAPLVLEFAWHWFDFLRHSCSGIAPGSSGSPVLSRRTGRIVGLVNTTTSGGRPAYTECSLDHPCEPISHGEASRPSTTYATPVIGLDQCFDRGWFRVSAPGCPLDPGEQVTLTPGRLGYVNAMLETLPIGRPQTRWNVRVSGPFEVYRYKVTWADRHDCRDLRGYMSPRLVREQPVIDDRLPRGEGWWFLCVIGGDGTGTRWQPVAFPTVATVRIDTVPPRVDAPLTIEDDDFAWRVIFRLLVPEISTYAVKFGNPATLECEDASGYRSALVPFLGLPKRDGPYRFCAIPFDAAGNPGRTFDALLQ